MKTLLAVILVLTISIFAQEKKDAANVKPDSLIAVQLEADYFDKKIQAATENYQNIVKQLEDLEKAKIILRTQIEIYHREKLIFKEKRLEK